MAPMQHPGRTQDGQVALMDNREFPPPPCEDTRGHYMIPVTHPETNQKTWRCTYCPAIRHYGNRTIHPAETT